MDSNLQKLDGMPASKAVLSNVLPAMIGMIMALVYNMADLFFIGKTGDPLQTAAISLATPIFLIFMSAGNIFGIGGASIISRSLGAGNKKLVSKISSFCFWSVIAIGIILTGIMLFNMDAIVQALGASPSVAPMVNEYLSIFSISGVFVLISSCFSGLVRAEGNAAKSMMGMLIGNVVNIILDPIFILGFDLGVQGAALATLIGNVCGAVYYFIYLFRKNTLLSINIKNFTMSEGIFKNVMLIGIPASLASILMSVSQILVNGKMAEYGDLAVAGIGVGMRVTMITSMICIGIGMGVQPLLGYAIGAKNHKRYKELFNFAMAFALSISGVLTVLCYLGLEQIVGSFVTDPAAFEYAYKFSQILLSTAILFGVLNVIVNALQAAGAATASLIVNVSRQGLVFIPLVYILGGTLGIYGIVMAQPIADITAITIAIILYIITNKKIFQEHNAESKDSSTISA